MSKEKGNNITIKIFALAIAIIMWMYVASEINPEITKEFRNIKVDFKNIDALESAGVTAIEPKEASVNVKVAGRRSDMLRITEDDITAKVNLDGYSEGSKKVPVEVEINSNRVRIVDYDPKVISFKFDTIARKEEKVTVVTEGKLKADYILGEPEARTSSVFLKGPKSLVESIGEVVAIADIEGRTTDINLTAPVKALDKNGNEVEGVHIIPGKVEVYIPVYKVKTVPVKIQTEGQLPEDYEVLNMKMTPETVKIKGNKDIIDKIDSINTVPLNYERLLSEENIILDLELPENIQLIDSDGKVNVSFDIDKLGDPDEPEEEIKAVSFEYDIDELEIKGLDEEFNIDREESTSSITVNIKGGEDKIKSITKKDLTPILDLTNLTEGSHNIEVEIKEIDGIELVSIKPSSVEIVLKKN